MQMGLYLENHPISALQDAVCSCTWYRVCINVNAMCYSQYDKSKAVGEKHGEDLTSAILCSGQDLRFARHEAYSD